MNSNLYFAMQKLPNEILTEIFNLLPLPIPEKHKAEQWSVCSVRLVSQRMREVAAARVFSKIRLREYVEDAVLQMDALCDTGLAGHVREIEVFYNIRLKLSTQPSGQEWERLDKWDKQLQEARSPVKEELKQRIRIIAIIKRRCLDNYLGFLRFISSFWGFLSTCRESIAVLRSARNRAYLLCEDSDIDLQSFLLLESLHRFRLPRLDRFEIWLRDDGHVQSVVTELDLQRRHHWPASHLQSNLENLKTLIAGCHFGRGMWKPPGYFYTTALGYMKNLTRLDTRDSIRALHPLLGGQPKLVYLKLECEFVMNGEHLLQLFTESPKIEELVLRRVRLAPGITATDCLWRHIFSHCTDSLSMLETFYFSDLVYEYSGWDWRTPGNEHEVVLHIVINADGRRLLSSHIEDDKTALLKLRDRVVNTDTAKIQKGLPLRRFDSVFVDGSEGVDI